MVDVIKKHITSNLFYLVNQLFISVTSSAEIEKLYSTIGLLHGKLEVKPP